MSRIGAEEIQGLMRQVVNRLYTFSGEGPRSAFRGDDGPRADCGMDVGRGRGMSMRGELRHRGACFSPLTLSQPVGHSQRRAVSSLARESIPQHLPSTVSKMHFQP